MDVNRVTEWRISDPVSGIEIARIKRESLNGGAPTLALAKGYKIEARDPMDGNWSDVTPDACKR